MARELGPIEQWSEEERALYILLLEQYGQLTDARLVYQVPGDSDLSRTQAVEQARNAVLSKFSISEETLDAMTTDVIFAADDYNPFGVPESEPFYIVEFGYGYAYRVYMTQTGEMLGNVLLRYDGSNMDAEPAGKMFDQVLRLDVTLADLWRERCGELGMAEWFCNVNGDYYYIDPWRKRLPSPAT